MSKYSTIQQRQPLRTPSGWSAEEKRLIIQLEDVLDDIYRRFGRLALKDLDESFRRQITDDHDNVVDLLLSAEEFSVKLGQLEEATPDMLVNTSMRLDQDGIFLSGGVLDMEAGTNFRVKSGGAVQIDAKDGANSFIRLGDGNFNVTQSGDMSTRTGDFSESLKVGSQPVWHGGNAIVSASKPKGHGVLWIQPSTVSTVRYSMYTGTERNHNLPGTHTFELTADSSDLVTASQITYSLSIPVYEISGTNQNVRVQARMTKPGFGTVLFPEYTLARINQWELKHIQVSVESSINLLSNTDPIQLTLTVTDSDTPGLFLQREMEIALVASIPGANAESQLCTLHWIP